MSILYRVTYIGHDALLYHEWHPTMMTGELRVQELDVLGMESVDIEEVDVPWDHLADLIHWLNNNVNTPKLKEESVSNINPATMRPYPPQRAGAATCEPEAIRDKPPTPLHWQDVPKPSALDVQVDGNHYKGRAIQPIEYIHANGLPFIEGSVVKYITRWRDKGGVKDLEKIKHYIDLLIELEQRKPKE